MAKDFYAMVLKSGQFSKCADVSEFNRLPESVVECYLFARYDHTFTGTSNITDWYQFYFVDRSGSPSTYRVGHFEVTFVGVDNGYTNFFGRNITIRDCNTDKYYEYKSTVWYNSFIPKEIKPLLTKLNDATDEEDIIKVLDTHVSYDSLMTKYNHLKQSYNALKDKYDLLKSKVDTLINNISELQILND